VGVAIGALIAILDPEATVTADGGGLVTAALRPIEGGEQIARFYLHRSRQSGHRAHMRPSRRHGRGFHLRDHRVPGTAREKGDQLGMFHFGGSTHCLMFRPGVRLDFDFHGQTPGLTSSNIPVNARIAAVVRL
jgi:hypothetical protein